MTVAGVELGLQEMHISTKITSQNEFLSESTEISQESKLNACLSITDPRRLIVLKKCKIFTPNARGSELHSHCDEDPYEHSHDQHPKFPPFLSIFRIGVQVLPRGEQQFY
ncbi:hypothetical protein Mal48_23600 [Thalassoglobus polymorphus]|uniref:Uncharacterized protein n=1 Tax=Thalassoglobus polymorphus TaxID=2527994 RepID=A0A517QN89_9PLAN|nr:hypothetical protein Mal48_23600 [Thalassoglobus polymorphus]